jgi:hypothetical protein
LEKQKNGKTEKQKNGKTKKGFFRSEDIRILKEKLNS